MTVSRRDAPGPADYALSCVAASVAGDPAPEPPAGVFYARPAACFVTLKKHGRLRGCIGTLEPSEDSLGREVARNARGSALCDPRFAPVTRDELEALTCSVDVLGPSHPCSLADLDPGIYGVIVEAGSRRGVLLPALAGVDTVDDQVEIVLRKAGIRPDQTYDVRRFEVRRYHQGEPHRDGRDASGGGPVYD